MAPICTAPMYAVMMATHRKTLRHIEVPGQARYLTFSCYQRLPLFTNDVMKDAFALQIENVRQRGAFRLLAWVIMPEHVHLIVVPNLPHWTMPRILRALKMRFAQRMIEQWKSCDAAILPRVTASSGAVHFWQRGGGYDRNVEVDGELIEKIEYVNGNPVRRGLVKKTTDWLWSSARWYAGDRNGVVAIDPFT